MNTVNVITTDAERFVQAVNAFEDTPEGNQQAEAIFKKKLNTVLDLDVTEYEAETFIEDGFAENGAGETCQLVHSVNHSEE